MVSIRTSCRSVEGAVSKTGWVSGLDARPNLLVQFPQFPEFPKKYPQFPRRTIEFVDFTTMDIHDYPWRFG